MAKDRVKPVVIGALVGGALGYAAGKMMETAAPAPGVPTDPPPVPVPEYDCPVEGTRVAMIGDSYAAGLAPQTGKLAQGCGVPFHGDGRVGTSALSWQKDSWLAPVLATSPTVVLISLGGNDFQRGNAETMRQAIETIVTKIRAAGARPAWIEPLELPFEDKLGVKQMWQAAVKGDFFPAAGIDYPRAPDGIHLFPAGYEDWATKIWRWMSVRTHLVSA